MSKKKEVMQLTEWTDFRGRVRVHFDELVGTNSNWIAPARILKMNVIDFLMMLKKEYAADLRIYKGADGQVRFVGYSWTSSNLAHARRFKNKVNKVIRDNNLTLQSFM